MTFRRLLFLLLLFTNIQFVQAQLPNGSIAPDVTFTDLNGNTHNLYDILDQGVSVIFDCFATWCGPCWNYHNTHTLDQVYTTYGPGGSGDVAVFAIETSPSTTEPCLYGPSGCTGGTTGNWVSGTSYPIVHAAGSNAGNFSSLFQVNFYPTLYKICPNRKIYQVGQPPYGGWVNWISACELEATETITNSACAGDAQGAINLDVMGGNNSISYSWSNGANSQDISNLLPGTYSCTITEGLGHSVEVGPLTVEGPANPLNPSIVGLHDPLCFNDGTGFVDLEVVGGGSSYSYNWSNGMTTQDLVNVGGGNYTVTVTDNHGCEEVEFATVFEPPMLNLTGFSLDENCGQSDGSISLFASGGTGTFLYDLGFGASPNNVFTNLAAGSYDATVTDLNFCEEIVNITVNAVPAPIADAGDNAVLSCTTPSATLDGSASTTGANILIQWSTSDGNIVSGANTTTPEVNQPGLYILTVTNTDNNCQSISNASVSGDVNIPTANAGMNQTLDCNVSTVTLNGNGSSSGSNVNYEWFDENNVSLGTSVTIDVSQAGMYELIVTNNDNGCSESSTAVVTENMVAPVADAGAANQLNCAVNTIELNGTASSSGANINYSWTNSAGTEIGTASTVTVDQPDTYTLAVVNTSNGCLDESTVTITENTSSPNADAGISQLLTCNLTTVTLTGSTSASGSAVSYSWTDGSGTVISTEQTVIVDEPGTYTFGVIDGSNNCEDTDAVDINQNVDEPISDAGAPAILNCLNSTVTIGGNSSTGNAIVYTWFDEDNDVVGNEATLEVSAAGNYTLQVDNTLNGCSAVNDVDVDENMAVPIADAGVDAQLDCINSTVSLDGSGSGNSSDLDYEWQNSSGAIVGTSPSIDISTADEYTLIITDNVNGCSESDRVEVTSSNDFPTAATDVSGALTCVVSNIDLLGTGSSTGGSFSYEWFDENGQLLATTLDTEADEAGTYTLVVSDNDNGCSASSDIVVENDEAEPTADISTPDFIDCSNTEVTLDASGSDGTNLSYSWTDASGQNVGDEAEISVSNPGIYNLIITDGENGCTDDQQVEVSALSEVEVTASSNPVLCNGAANGSAAANASGGAGNFSYQWSDDQNTATATSLEAGEYTVTATDENGCTSTTQVIIEQPSALIIEINSTDESGDNLNNGSATATVQGGTSDYTYEWSSGQSSASIDNLEPGSYTLTVIDANGCEEIAAVNINGFDCFLQIETIKENVSCAGENSGSISIISTTGNASVFVWSNGLTTSTIDNLSAGIYQYTVMDDTNCEINGEVIIDEPTEINVSISDVQDISCLTGQSGSATVIASGGSGNLTYLWSNGETGTTAINLVAGDNTLTVRDENGCEKTSTVFIGSDDDTENPIVLTQNITVVLDDAGNASITTAQIDNGSSDNCGIANLSLDQSNFDCSQVGMVEVTLTVTDISGNTAEEQAFITVRDEQIPTISCMQDIVSNSCGIIEFDAPTVEDNCANYEVELVNGLTSGSVFPEGETMVSYRVTDAGGNIADCSFTVTVMYDLEVTILGNDALCFGEANGSATAEPSGGTPGYEYEWSNGQQTATATGLIAGDYDVEITDNTGCVVTKMISIEEPTIVEVEVDDITDDNGTGIGSIDITASGGVGNYGYTWTLDGVFFSNEEDLTGLSAGNYAVEIADGNGCVISQFGLIVEETTSINTLSIPGKVSLVPNPAKDQIWLDIAFESAQDVVVDIFHSSGQFVTTNDFGKVLAQKQAINLEGMIAGVYLFRIKIGSDLLVKRVVVMD